jgi:hypothetical protein
MRKKRGLVSVVLATVMIVGGLTGCVAEKVTAESLVSNAFGSEEVKSLDADVTLNLDMDVDASELTGSDTTMNIAIGLDCNVKSTEDVAYTDGKATISFFGTKTKADVKTYADIKEGVVYNYDEDSDSWVKSDLDSSSFDFSSVSNKIDTDVFENLELAETKSKDEDYTVTGTISSKKLQDLLGEDLSDFTSVVDTSELDLDNLNFDVTMIFDRSSKLIKVMSYSVDPKAFDSDSYTINKFDFSITLNSLNENDDLSIPEDVTKNAVEKDTSFGGFEDDLDSSFGVDSDETSSELSVEDNQTLAQIYLDTPFAYQDDIEGLLVNYYPNIKNLDNDTMISLMTFFNNYAADDFANYLDVYEYWSESEKKALALLYDLGIVDDDTLTSFDISKVDVQSYVDDYITPLK